MVIRHRKRWRKPIILGLLLTILLGGLALAGLWTLGIVTVERHQGYFGSALAADGQHVWFFQRNAAGLAVGMGWEHFSPPARVFLFQDQLSLRRYDRRSGRVETLLHWPSSPLQGQKLKHYRGRILGQLGARIRAGDAQKVEYAARMSLLRVPRSETWSLSGSWSETDSPKADWQQADTSLAGLSEPIVIGPLEVMTLPGEEGFPAAIALLDHQRRQVEVLIRNQAFARLYPDAPSFKTLLKSSRKAEVDRRNEMRRTYEKLIAAFRSEGLNEGAALLAAGREMARLGWWPSPAAVTASPAETFPEGMRIFTIDPEQFRVGLFPDLEQALATPGQPVTRSGRYVRHRDYSTSEELNEFLATSPEAFGVQVDGRRWLMTLTPPKPPSR